MKSLENKLIIYDSNCKVCSSLRDIVLRLTPITAEKVRAFASLDETPRPLVDVNKFRNVMALIDMSGGPTIYGAEAIAYIFASQYRIVHFLLSIPAVFKAFAFLYKTQAYNRYIIATPKSKFHCDCFPDRVVKYRISYILMTILISVALTALAGISLRNLVGIQASTAAIQMLLIAGSGWLLQILLAMAMLRDKALDYVGHLGSIMVAGLLILVPAIFLYVLTGIQLPHFAALSVMASSAYMLYLHLGRVRYLELSQLWTVCWFLMLQGTALFWIYVFYIK